MLLRIDRNWYLGKRLLSLTARSYLKAVTLAYDEYKGIGKLIPVIIMHTLFGNRENWQGIATILAKRTQRTILTLNARNHGDSTFTNEHNSILLAADVLKFLRYRGYEKAIVIGHGMSGRAMMYLALKYPKIVESAIILDVSPIANSYNFLNLDQIFIIMRGIEIPKTYTMTQAKEMMSELFHKIIDSKENVQFILNNLKRKSDGEYFWNINVDVLSRNIRSFENFQMEIRNFPPYLGRTLFICSNQSNFLEPDSWPFIQIWFPNSEIHWLDCSHLIHTNEPNVLVDLVIEFLNKSNDSL